jgi:hypothetical protein
MKKCLNASCGKESHDDAGFCYNCGNSFDTNKKYIISYPDGCLSSCIRIQNSSKGMDETVKFYSQVKAAFFREAIECWNHQLYFGCIAFAAESVAKAISIELLGGNSINKRENIYPKGKTGKLIHEFQTKVQALVNKYPQLAPLQNNMLTLYEHNRKIWLHGIEKSICYCKAHPSLGNMDKIVAKSGHHETPLGYMITIPLGGLTKDELQNEYGMQNLQIILKSDGVADECITLAIPILKSIAKLYE